jgi:purine-binding chemotaxis protein CheW
MFRDGILQLLVFGVGGERFAVPIGAADEVIEMPAVRAVPDAPATMMGVATVRGELVTTYDPRVALRVERHAHVRQLASDLALVFTRQGRRVALAVEDVFDPIAIAEGDLKRLHGADATDATLLGVVRREDELIAVLDAERLLDVLAARREEEEGKS